MNMTPTIFLPVSGFSPNQQAWLSGKPGIFQLAKRLAITLDDVIYQDRNGKRWTVPKGMPTDGMSYPIVVEWMWNRFDPDNLRSGVTHDYTYALHDFFDDWPATREEADRNLLDGLILDDGEWERAKYAAVRLCGNFVWRHKSRNELFRQWLRFAQFGSKSLDYWITHIKNKGTV